MKIAQIIEFPAIYWELHGDPGLATTIKAPIKIKDLATSEILEFDYFIWADKTGAISPPLKIPQKISYEVEDRVGCRVLKFKVL